MRRKNIERFPATQLELQIVAAARLNQKELVGQEIDNIAFFARVGKKLQVSEGDRRWLETLGKRLGLIEATTAERARFAEVAEKVRKLGGRKSPRYFPAHKRRR
ncbi:MAG: hypothetical protein R3332_00355 [Pseudohongiellaceae bacterium]|nr:hypothetical protein [Pseudohongiellaceae bacterium]